MEQCPHGMPVPQVAVLPTMPQCQKLLLFLKQENKGFIWTQTDLELNSSN